MPKKEHILNFFKNPIAVFTYAVLLALAIALFPEHEQQIMGIIGVCTLFILGSFFNVIWHEKVSARGYQMENIEYREKINTLEGENNRLSELNEELEREIPKVIRYNSVYKRIKIKDNSGNATYSITQDGYNISNRPIQTIKQTITTENQSIPKKALINGEQVIPRIKSIPFGKLWQTEIILDALEAIDPEDPIVTSYEVKFDKEYGEAFEENKESSSAHSIYLRVDEFITEIEAPEGFIFHPNPRIDIRDLFHETQILEEIGRINNNKECRPILDSSRTKIKWKVKHPRLAYTYEIYFHLSPKS